MSLDVPIYFVSPVAKKSLAFANVNAEWLSEGRQNNVYIPEEPFIHSFVSFVFEFLDINLFIFFNYELM